MHPCVMMNDLAGIPSVERILQLPETLDLISCYGRQLVLGEIRKELADIRRKKADELSHPAIPPIDIILKRVSHSLELVDQNSIQPVINATGVILHTNLGRAPLSRAAVQAIDSCGTDYSTLEFDLDSGGRSKRTFHIERLLQQFLGIESALVVNNNAAAVFLVLSSLANRRSVIVPRNQMIEIGGGFRIPDILSQSHARLMEIGTTNQIHLDDYRNAIQAGGSLILHVHPSNFKITGFSSEPPLKEITNLAHSANLPIVDDLGSGALIDTNLFGLAHETTVQESLDAGVDIVCFSGDKLFGGPQGGIIIGKSKYLDKVKKHPLARVVRADKMLIAGLEATLLHYMKGQAVRDVPVWRMISAKPIELHNRVESWIKILGEGTIQESQSTIGGGSLPEETLPTWILSISVKKPETLAAILREQSPPVIIRIQDGRICFDPRTILPEQDDTLVSSISTSLKQFRENHEE